MSSKLKSWRDEIDGLPLYQPARHKMLIVCLDEIDEYLLWRNSLYFYKSSAKWKHHHITLLASRAWKTVFEYADMAAVDDIIWITKEEYLKNNKYRLFIWKQLRSEGFETVICPSKKRTPLFDDLCVLATGSPNTIAIENTTAEKQVSAVSDSLYKYVYYNRNLCHNFFFNQQFANWCCLTNYYLTQPQIDSSLLHPPGSNYIICYIGSNKSRQIAVTTWIELIILLKQQFQKKIVIAGGKTEEEKAKQIKAIVEIEDITGSASLSDTLTYTAFADAVITGDTMAAHLAVSFGIPTVIVANGDNTIPFSDYKEAGISKVETVYAKPFLQTQNMENGKLFSESLAVADDIKTISAEDILQTLQKIYTA